MITLYLSESAWKGLKERAIRVNYISGFIRARGVGDYMWVLVKKNPSPSDWEDTRPISYRAFEMEELEEGQLPVWDSGEDRFRRYLADPPLEIRRFIQEIAATWGTFRSRVPGGWNRFSQTQIESAFWEAVGIGWLTPKEEPLPQPPRYQRKVRTELEW